MGQCRFRERPTPGELQKSISRREVPFGRKTNQILKARYEREPESEYVLGKRPKVVPDRVSRQLRTVSESLGIGGVTLHAVRRTFFRRMVDSGAGPQSLRAIGGWSVPIPVIKSFIHRDQLLKIAIRAQARLEEQ